MPGSLRFKLSPDIFYPSLQAKSRAIQLGVISPLYVLDRDLLLPAGCTRYEQQKARILVKIYGAEDLPTNLGVLANMKRAFAGDNFHNVDPYVQITYAGIKVGDHSDKT